MINRGVLSVHDARVPDAIHWVVVADAGRAQFYAADVLLTELLPIEGRVSPPPRDEERHRQPRPRAAHDTRFARSLGEVLREGRIDKRFERLVLIAPPHFLGMLRGQLDRETSKRVIATITHDWLALGTDELALRVRDAVASTQLIEGGSHDRA